MTNVLKTFGTVGELRSAIEHLSDEELLVEGSQRWPRVPQDLEVEISGPFGFRLVTVRDLKQRLKGREDWAHVSTIVDTPKSHLEHVQGLQCDPIPGTQPWVEDVLGGFWIPDGPTRRPAA